MIAVLEHRYMIEILVNIIFLNAVGILLDWKIPT